MKLKLGTILLLSVLLSFSCGSNSSKKANQGKDADITFVSNEAENRIDVMVDGKLFTTFQWPDNVCKPVLYPVLTSAGTTITRGFPIATRPGERADHPHQIGMWLTYGNVDGLDFWGNGSKGLGTRNANGGVIKHIKVDKLTSGKGEGSIITTESWVDSTGKELLLENTEFHFIADGSTRIIDRITTLTASDKDVSMPDTKEGMFGIRVARQLELPSTENIALTDAQGNITTVKAMSNEGVSGNYLSSEGITGDAVWGTRAKWMDLYGNIGDEKISLVICDHPKNQSYPTYWHARGYGLFAANPLGVKDFTKGKEELNFSIPAGKSTTFRYRFIISSGAHLSENEINAYSDDFAGKY
jgi:hypothetical protein